MPILRLPPLHQLNLKHFACTKTARFATKEAERNLFHLKKAHRHDETGSSRYLLAPGDGLHRRDGLSRDPAVW